MFGSYFELGLEHILDVNGLDHVLFLVALTILYRLQDWKKVIILATAFTIGHSVTLALSALDIISINSELIELLIAITIFTTAILNIFDKSDYKYMIPRYLSALIFGFIHGMGFSNFFKAILGNDSLTIPLLGFNLGVEIAQIIIVISVLLVGHVVVSILKLKQKWWIISISLLIALWSLTMIMERI